MEEKTIQERIRHILEGIADRRFYKKSQDNRYLFDYEPTTLLLKLEKKTDKIKEKQYFWNLLGYTFLHLVPTLDVRPLHLKALSPNRMIRLVCDYADCCFMTYLKSNRINQALDGLLQRAINHDHRGITDENYRILIIIQQTLKYEDYIYTNSQLKKIEKIREMFRLAISSGQTSIRRPKFTGGITTIRQLLRLLEQFEVVISEVDGLLKKINYEREKNELLEIELQFEQDKEIVQQNISKYGFGRELEESLLNFEKEYIKADSEFEYKTCLGHIRSFIESLLAKITDRVHSICQVEPNEALDTYGNCRNYLRKRIVGFYSEKQDSLVGGIYSFVSDAGVHKIKSQKECVRLGRNIAIECAVFLFERLNRYISERHKP